MTADLYDATGVLVLRTVTPVIKALFEPFNLDEFYPGNGRAAISQRSGSQAPQWGAVLDGLTLLAASLDLPASEETLGMEDVLTMLAEHFDTKSYEFEGLIEHHSFEGTADLDPLFLIATCFDDGHQLTVIEFEGAWRSANPNPFGFGGEGFFLSQEVRLCSHSYDAIEFGMELREAVLAVDIEKAALAVTREADRLLAGISDQQFGQRVRRRVADQLAEPPIGGNPD